MKLANFPAYASVPVRLQSRRDHFLVQETTYDFSSALTMMRKGTVMTRKFWKNILAVAFLATDPPVQPLFLSVTVDEQIVLGHPFSAADILTSDWVVVE